MRVLVNVLSLPETKTGVGHYVAELSSCLPGQDPDLAVQTFPTRPWWVVERVRRH